MAIKGSATITLTQYRDTQSVTRYYKLQPAGSSAPLKPETKPPSSDWTDSEPACDISKELYFCDLTIFSNGEGEYSKVSKSTSYEASKQAYNKADNAQKSIDNLEIGGRNYITKIPDSNITSNGITVEVSDNVVHIHGTNTKTDSAFGIGYFAARDNIFEPETTYTISTTEPIPTGLYLGLNSRNTSGTSCSAGNGSYLYGDGNMKSLTFTTRSDIDGRLNGFFGVLAKCGTVDVTFKIKLEIGNRATDWTPAPEDVDAGIANAQTAADSKRRVFYNTPTVPYDAGDLWVQGSGGDILRCAQAKTSAGSYNRNDWVLASKYTDDSALTTWIEGDFATTIQGLEEGLVDAKIETYYQATDPSTGWSDTQKSEHKGDLWYNSTASVQKYYRWSGTAWQELTATPPQAVFDNIDKKATIYTGTTTPTNPSSGDLWFKGANEPILTYVNNSWVEYNKYTDDSEANNALTKIDNLELTKIDRFGTNASMKWDGNILKIEAVDPGTNVPYAVEIGGNGIEFKYDNEAVAMINQDQLVIDKTVVLTEMQVNRYWTWRTRDNNNLCLQWIGGSN